MAMRCPRSTQTRRMLAAKTCPALPARAARASARVGLRPASGVSSRRVATKAIEDTNLFVNILGSGLAGAAVAAVTTCELPV